jgi:hypothetical protein
MLVGSTDDCDASSVDAGEAARQTHPHPHGVAAPTTACGHGATAGLDVRGQREQRVRQATTRHHSPVKDACGPLLTFPQRCHSIPTGS